MPAFADPGPNCRLCPRLAGFRDDWAAAEPSWHNAPVPAFGPLDAPLLVVGLAPGLRGANRTGRPFTGDGAGDVLYPALIRHGFVAGHYDRRPDDGLRAVDVRITNAVRCVPPENKPTGAETRTCRPFLIDEIAAMPNLRLILSLGALSHDQVLAVFGLRKAAAKFTHGAVHDLPNGRPQLADSYHCSRYNISTKRLTPEMFDRVLADLRRRLTVSPARA